MKGIFRRIIARAKQLLKGCFPILIATLILRYTGIFEKIVRMIGIQDPNISFRMHVNCFAVAFFLLCAVSYSVWLGLQEGKRRLEKKDV